MGRLGKSILGRGNSQCKASVQSLVSLRVSEVRERLEQRKSPEKSGGPPGRLGFRSALQTPGNLASSSSK